MAKIRHIGITTRNVTEGTPNNWIGERKWLTPDGIPIDVNQSGWKIRLGGPRGE